MTKCKRYVRMDVCIISSLVDLCDQLRILFVCFFAYITLSVAICEPYFHDYEFVHSIVMNFSIGILAWHSNLLIFQNS